MRHKTIDKSQKNSNIGAGPMGLAVAYQLVKDGYKPVVYEADDRIGGMTASFYLTDWNREILSFLLHQ